MIEGYRGLFWADPQPLTLTGEYVYEDRGIAHRSGAVVRVQVHRDPRLQLLLEQTREWEVVQAIDRLRLLRCEKRKLIVIFNNLPLPVQVDHLVHLSDLLPVPPRWLRYARELGGVLVKKGKWLAEKLPTVFADRRAAQNYLSREEWQNNSSLNRDLIETGVVLPTNPTVTEAAFVPADTRVDRLPKPTAAIVLGPPMDIPSKLQEACRRKLRIAFPIFDGLAFVAVNDFPEPGANDNTGGFHVTRHVIRQTLEARNGAPDLPDPADEAA